MALIGPDVSGSGGSGSGGGGSTIAAYTPGAPNWEPAYDGNNNDNNSHVLNGDVALVAAAEYEIVLQPVVPTDFVQGWLCMGDTATAGGGQRLTSSYPFRLRPATATKISFMRDSTTAFAYRISVTRVG